jgi:hypothetical protein
LSAHRQGYEMHLRLFSDFSHKHFVIYSQSVPKQHRGPPHDTRARAREAEALSSNELWEDKSDDAKKYRDGHRQDAAGKRR